VTSAVDIKWTGYIPHVPTPKQHAFLWLTIKEAFFGGAAGGGKSDALLMAALQYVDVPGYAAIIFRRSYTDLALPGAIMDRAQAWLTNTDARWNDNDKEFLFPSGAKVTFAYLKAPNDKYRYQSAEFQFIGIDEITQWPEEDYTYLMSRLRRPSEGPLSRVPLRARAAANPGGVGHVWVKKRFVDGRSPDRVFIPSSLDDNPHLDQETYEQSLALLDPITHAQLRHGDWTIRPPGLWTFDHVHIEAAVEIGRHFDKLRERGEMAPPVDSVIRSGTDFGDFRTVFEIGWQLERGGMYTPPGEVVTSRLDLEDITSECRQSAKLYRGWWWKANFYDSAFAQSARTMGKLLQKDLGRHNAILGTGRPNMVPISFKEYKQLSIKYGRLLLKNATLGPDATRVAAISPRNELLVDQLQMVQQKETNPDLTDKKNDDAVDAWLAKLAPLARRHRHIIEKMEQDAKQKAVIQPPAVDEELALTEEQVA